ncbi:MAG: hypothetical protein U0894_06955 [Pirellulales bacterium]
MATVLDLVIVDATTVAAPVVRVTVDLLHAEIAPASAIVDGMIAVAVADVVLHHVGDRPRFGDRGRDDRGGSLR